MLVLAGCGVPEAEVGPARTCTLRLVYQAGPSVSVNVQVRGEWAGFAPEPMIEKDGVWSWQGTLPARDQGYGYLFDVNGQTVRDPLNGFTRWVAEAEVSRLAAPDCSRPLLEVAKFQVSAEGALVAQVVGYRGLAGPALRRPDVTLDAAPVDASFDAKTGLIRVERAALAVGKHWLRVTVADESGATAPPLALPFWVESKPFHWADALMYFAFTDRFRDGDPSNSRPTPGVDAQANYQGGDWAGLAQAIDEGYFDRLGVRALWVSPVEANPDDAYVGTNGRYYTGYHGYWPSAPRTTQSRFGSLEDLRHLTSVAHAHGIRVVADVVLNHVHQTDRYFVEHQSDGWFNTGNGCVCGAPGCGWDERPLVCWFTSYLPDFNWRNSAMADQLVADTLWWLENGDFDGFRVDAVKHFDVTAVRALRASLASLTAITGTEFYLVGETFTGAGEAGRAQLKTAIGPQLLDGQFDFPLYWPVVDTFARQGSFRALDEAVHAGEAAFGQTALNAPFLGNHDVARFMSYAANQVTANPEAQAWDSETKPPPSVDRDDAFARATAAFTFLLSQKGVPLIYYGDEIGLPGAGDPDNRRFMKFTNLSTREAALLATVQKLGRARQAHGALRTGSWQTLSLGDDVWVYRRADEREGVLVAFNRGPKEVGTGVTVPKSSVDVLTGTRYEAGATLTVPPNASLLLVEE